MLIYAASALLASKPRIRMISLSMKPWEGYDIRIGYVFFTWQNYPFLEVWPSHDVSISFRSLYLALISLRWWQWYSSDKFWFAPGGIICGWFWSRICRFWSMSEWPQSKWCRFAPSSSFIPRVNCCAQVPKLKDVRFSRRFFSISQDVSEFCQMRVSENMATRTRAFPIDSNYITL